MLGVCMGFSGVMMDAVGKARYFVMCCYFCRFSSARWIHRQQSSEMSEILWIILGLSFLYLMDDTIFSQVFRVFHSFGSTLFLYTIRWNVVTTLVITVSDEKWIDTCMIDVILSVQRMLPELAISKWCLHSRINQLMSPFRNWFN